MAVTIYEVFFIVVEIIYASNPILTVKIIYCMFKVQIEFKAV